MTSIERASRAFLGERFIGFRPASGKLLRPEAGRRTENRQTKPTHASILGTAVHPYTDPDMPHATGPFDVTITKQETAPDAAAARNLLYKEFHGDLEAV